MTKIRSKLAVQRDKDFALFFRDVEALRKVKVSKKVESLVLPEYPFDGEALTLSSLYRKSRTLYMANGGTYSPKVCSVARSLSSHDLFRSYIEYSPIRSELLWFQQGGCLEVTEPSVKLEDLLDKNGISLYHEQNHRIVWELLPPAPAERLDLGRYLNFAESLIVTLDLALADQIGKKLSPSFERLKTIYRTSEDESWSKKSKKEYRQYLTGLVIATYFLLELYEPEDIAKGLNYVFPKQKKLVRDVTKRSLGLSILFIQNTNILWQDRYWQFAQERLGEMHLDSSEDPFYLPENPLEFTDHEFSVITKVFAEFGL